MENKALVLWACCSVLIFVFLLALPLWSVTVSAWVGNSTNYNITISNIDYAAYDGHSANFNIDFSLVEQYVGWNESPSFNTSYGFYAGVNYTGYSVGGPFDISIDADDPVTVSTTATATVTLTNQNPDFFEDALLEYWIEDQTGAVISQGSQTVYVGSLSTVVTTVTLAAPGSTGVFIYYARVTWSSIYTASASDSFTVIAAAPSPGPGPGPSVPILRIIQYPKNITIERGDFAYFTIKVKNIGGAIARNTVLLIENLSQYWFSVEPQSMDIAAGENKSYALKFQIPSDAEIGSYDFVLEAVSGSKKHRVSSTLNIVSAIPVDIRIVDIQIVPLEQRLKVNETGKIYIFVQNTGDKNTSVTLQLPVPDSWSIENETITKIVNVNDINIFEFIVTPHEVGTFELIISMTYENKIETRAIVVVVEDVVPEEEEFWLWFLIIILIILGAILMKEFDLARRKKKSGAEKGREARREAPAAAIAAVAAAPARAAPLEAEVKEAKKPKKKKGEEGKEERERRLRTGPYKIDVPKPSWFDRLLKKLKRKK